MAIPAVSVLIPVRNGERFLGEALAGVLADNAPSREIIVVDDGSTDGTRSIIENARQRDSRVVAVSQSATGLVAALERGRRYARSPFIARLDADDLAYPDRLRLQLAAFAADPELVLLGAAVDKIDATGRVIGKVAHPAAVADLLPLGNVLVHSAVMMRRSAVEAVGGYRSFFLAAEDYDLWLRLAERGRVANLPARLGAYRVHAESVTSRHALRQAFSAALARKCAEARRAGRSDPSQGREEPVDIEAEVAPADTFAAEIRRFRALSFADEAIFARRRPAPADIDVLRSGLLDPTERKFAQLALFNMLRLNARPPSLSRRAALREMYRLDAWRAVRLLAGLRRRSP